MAREAPDLGCQVPVGAATARISDAAEGASVTEFRSTHPSNRRHRTALGASATIRCRSPRTVALKSWDLEPHPVQAMVHRHLHRLRPSGNIR